ncbi:MAG TPA: hypothetical protein VFH78_04575 [Candidatus Thermoplasmatota archaeon]|nr:hypothetical protein [Candidatus Thermoplasmatota archaeon]
MRSILLVAGLLLAAGCVGPSDGTTPAAVVERGPFVDPIADDHDHASFADHALWTPNMHLVGHTTMSEDGKPFSYIGEMDTYGNLTVVQVLGRGSTPGFVVLDTSDPAAPRPIGRAEMPYSYVVDVKWSPDGKHVFAASQAAPRPDAAAPFESLVTGWGFTQWDMSDPTAPVAVAGGYVPYGCHMLSVKELRGELTVFCISQGLVHVFAYAGEGAWTQVNAFGPGASLAGAQRVVSETLAAGPNAPFVALLATGPHDITIQEDPLEPGRFIASVSYWDFGLRFYDVTDPRSPVLLGAWGGQGADVYEGNVHGAMLYGHHGEQRLAVVGPELLGDTYPALWVLDVTDFANPTIVGEWVPPGQHATQGLLLTTHQFQVVDEKIYLAYNHAGVWVLDLHAIMDGTYKDDPTRPEVLGYYLPHQEVELYDREAAAVPNTWDVNVRDGFIFASDRYTGFYVLHYAGDEMGDANVTSYT